MVAHFPKGESQRLVSDLPAIRAPFSNGCGSLREWRRCSTFRSCLAWNGTSFDAKQAVRQRTVELTAQTNEALGFPLVSP
jgi:hypothetical protein